MSPIPNIQRILVPTDFSEFANEALSTAEQLAVERGAEMLVAHVVEPIGAYPFMDAGGPAPWPSDAELLAGAETRMAELVAGLNTPDLRVRTEVCSGKPAVQIVRIAEEESVDLVVIASHGRSGLAHALMGSVAERVVQKAPCAVLTIKPASQDFTAG